MNTLEFIESEIKSIKVQIRNAHNEWYEEVYTKKLQTLQQIKSELEAWEVIKEKFFIDIIERDNDYKIGFEPKTPIINETITRFAQLDKYKGTVIKQALEIENDK